MVPMRALICHACEECSGSDGIALDWEVVNRRVADFPIWPRNFLNVPNGYHSQPEKSLILNINNFFLDSLKQSERSKVWKFIHLWDVEIW